MTKKQLAVKIKDKTGYKLEAINKVINTLFDEIGIAITQKKKVLITKFGVFTTSLYNGNPRNPKTGIRVDTIPFQRPWFKAARELKNKVKAGTNNNQKGEVNEKD